MKSINYGFILALLIALSTGCTVMESLFSNKKEENKVQTVNPVVSDLLVTRIEDGSYRYKNLNCNGAAVTGEFLTTKPGTPIAKFSGNKVTLIYSIDQCEFELPFEVKSDSPGIFSYVATDTVKCSNESNCSGYLDMYYKLKCGGVNNIKNVLKYKVTKSGNVPGQYSFVTLDGAPVCTETHSGVDPFTFDLVSQGS
jgi:hypothetical protein